MTISNGEERALAMVHQLMVTVQAGDASAYHDLLSEADQSLMTVQDIETGMLEMNARWGALDSFEIRGVAVRAEAAYATVYLAMRFSLRGEATEVYHLTWEGQGWKLIIYAPDVG